MFAVSTHTTSSSVGEAQTGGSRSQERWAKMVLHSIWIGLVAAVCIMLGFTLAGYLSMATFFIALASASTMMFVVMIMADRSSRFPNPVGMPWVRMLRSLLRQVMGRD